MPTITTKLAIGDSAFGVTGGLDPQIVNLTVTEIRLTKPNEKIREDYLCAGDVDRLKDIPGVPEDWVWRGGTRIFATRTEAEAGLAAKIAEVAEQRAARDAERAAEELAKAQADLALYQELKARFGG